MSDNHPTAIIQAARWTLADLDAQVRDHSDITFARTTDDKSTLTVKAKTYEFTVSSDGLVATVCGHESPLRWAPTVSEWIDEANGTDLYTRLNAAFEELGVECRLQSISMLHLDGLKT